MKMKKAMGMALVTFLFGCAGIGWAADGTKIGVVDFEKILEDSTAGKAAKTEINRQGEKMEADIKKSGQDIEALETQRRKLEKDLADAKRQLAMGGGSTGATAGPEEIGGVQVIARVMDGVGGKDLRPIAEAFKKQLPDGVIALVGSADGKAAVTVAVTGSAAGRFSAVDLAKAAVQAMGGQGAGGRPDFAQGGAPDGAKAAEGLAAIKALLAV